MLSKNEKSATKPKKQPDSSIETLTLPSPAAKVDMVLKPRKSYPRDEQFEYVTPARLKREHTLIEPVDTRIILHGEQYAHLQIRGYMNGCTWDQYLRSLVSEDLIKHPHTTIRK